MKNKNIQIYPSDITGDQFENIREILESARKTTKPRTVDLHEVFNAALYVLRTGCQWRALPGEYPNWKTVHSYFTLWSEEGRGKEKKSLLSRCLKKIGAKRSRQPGAVLYDHLFDR